MASTAEGGGIYENHLNLIHCWSSKRRLTDSAGSQCGE